MNTREKTTLQNQASIFIQKICSRPMQMTHHPASYGETVRALTPSSDNALVAGVTCFKQKLPPIRFLEFQV